jgi:hypothetical protein
MIKTLLLILVFQIPYGINPFIWEAYAQNLTPGNDSLLTAPISDSAKALYEQRRQRSIETFGPHCRMNFNGLPKFVYDIKALNRGITALVDTEKAWQFLELNKDALGIIDPRMELKLDGIDDLEYSSNLDTAKAWQNLEKMFKNNPQIYGSGNPREKYSIEDLLKMGFAKKIKIGEYLIFYQYFKGCQVAGSEILFSFDTTGIIRALNYAFYPEARDIDFDSFVSEAEARRIAVEDTTIDWMIKDDPDFQGWMEWVMIKMPNQKKYLGKFICEGFEKYISCKDNECTIGYNATICANQDAYSITIDGKTGKVTYRGMLL